MGVAATLPELCEWTLMIVSTVVNMFSALSQAILIHVNTLAGVKLTNVVGPTMWADKVEPFDIPSQQCGNVCDQHDHTKFVCWFLSHFSAQQMCA